MTIDKGGWGGPQRDWVPGFGDESGGRDAARTAGWEAGATNVWAVQMFGRGA
jgi:hypothetical protein